MLAPYSEKVLELSKVIGRLEGNLNKTGVGGGSLGNFVTNGMRAQAEAKLGKPVTLAIMNVGGLRKNEISAGELRASDIFELLPFENALVALEVTGVQLQKLNETATRDAHIALDLTFNALTSAVGVDGQGRQGSGASAATSTTVGKGHLEQAGRWTGWIEADGVRHEMVDARGNRDKSWGPRRWGGPKMWRWFSINIGDDVHFGGIRIGTDAGDLHRGWVWTEGAHSSIKEWKVTSEVADDGVTHTATHVHATDKLGRVHELVPPDPTSRTVAWSRATAAFALGLAVAGYGVSFVYARTGDYATLFALGAVIILLALVIDLIFGRARS